MNMLRTLVALVALLPALVLAAATDISRDELKARLAKGTPTVILDVRSAEEYAEGHIAGAINIPHDAMATRADELAKHKTDGSIVLYCRSGRRAGVAAEALEAKGFTGLKHLEGDIQGWQAAGEPLAK